MKTGKTLSPAIEQALNQQIKMEALSSSKYLAAAAWCDAHGYSNSAEFLFAQADEERQHMMKIFHYVCDMGGHAISPSIGEVQHKFSSLREIFEYALESEVNVTEAIDEILTLARRENDYPTENFIQWFVTEQIEEEYIVRRAVELFDLMGEDKLALFMIDERIPKISFHDPMKGSEK